VRSAAARAAAQLLVPAEGLLEMPSASLAAAAAMLLDTGAAVLAPAPAPAPGWRLGAT
jgi:hypothetical protein